MKNQEEIEKEIINILGENSDGLSYDIRDVDRCASDIFSLLQSEKDKWKAKVLDDLDGLKVVEPPNEVGELSDKRQAFIAGQINLLMRIQQLREEVEKL